MKGVVIFLLFFVFVSCTKKENGFTIEGYIKNTGYNLKNAVIRIDNSDKLKTTSDENGYFRLINASEGNHILNIFKDFNDSSFVIENIEINITSDTILSAIILPTPVTINLEKISSDISNLKIKITWTKSDALDFYEYKVFRHSTSGIDENTGTLIHVAINSNDTTFIDSVQYNTNHFYRVYIKNFYNQIGGSNIMSIMSGDFENNPQLSLSKLAIGNLTKNKDLVYYFLADSGEFYKIIWYDSWWNEYTANSILVSVYTENEVYSYFNQKRLIQLGGSPELIYSHKNEKVYIRIEGFESNTEGTFGIKVDWLDKKLSSEIIPPMKLNTSISAGNIKLASFLALKDSSYLISMEADKYIGALGNNVEVKISAIGEKSLKKYFTEYPGVIEFAGEPNNKIITPEMDEKIFFTIIGAFWWNPREISLEIN